MKHITGLTLEEAKKLADGGDDAEALFRILDRIPDGKDFTPVEWLIPEGSRLIIKKERGILHVGLFGYAHDGSDVINALLRIWREPQ